VVFGYCRSRLAGEGALEACVAGRASSLASQLLQGAGGLQAEGVLR